MDPETETAMLPGFFQHASTRRPDFFDHMTSHMTALISKIFDKSEVRQGDNQRGY
jgi:hypothetical protein